MAHIQLNFYSQSLLNNVNVIVFLPTVSADDYLFDSNIRYGLKGMKYQTMYLLHGSYGDCTDWTRFTGLERYAQDKTLAVVMPSAENSNYVDMAYGEAYEKYITEELPEFLCKMFPLSRKREDTFIAGLSMGGFGSFHSALKHPEKYECAISLSGGLEMQMLQNGTEAHIKKMSENYRKAVFKNAENLSETDGDLDHILKKAVKEEKELPKMFMACGTEDFIYPTNEAFYEKAQKLGIKIDYTRAPGAHNWDFWDAHIKEALDWLPCKCNFVQG